LIFRRCPKGQHISVAFMHNRKTVWLFFIAERQLTRWLAQKTSHDFPII